MRDAKVGDSTTGPVAPVCRETQFEQDFGHPPTELPGSLGDDSKAIFRRAYVAELDKGVDPQTAANRAPSPTPFVAARARRKYTDIEVRATRRSE